ncbi:hypothetical protein D3C86_947690 [compost metagenome]
MLPKASRYWESASKALKPSREKPPSWPVTLLPNSTPSGYSTKNSNRIRQIAVRMPQGHHLIFMAGASSGVHDAAVGGDQHLHGLPGLELRHHIAGVQLDADLSAVVQRDAVGGLEAQVLTA